MEQTWNSWKVVPFIVLPVAQRVSGKVQQHCWKQRALRRLYNPRMSYSKSSSASMHTDAHNAMMRSSMMDRGDAWMCPDELGNDMTEMRRQMSEFLQPPNREDWTEVSGFLSFSRLLEVFTHWSVEHLWLSCIDKLTLRLSASPEILSSLCPLETRITSLFYIRQTVVLITLRENPQIWNQFNSLLIVPLHHNVCIFYFFFLSQYKPHSVHNTSLMLRLSPLTCSSSCWYQIVTDYVRNHSKGPCELDSRGLHHRTFITNAAERVVCPAGCESQRVLPLLTVIYHKMWIYRNSWAQDIIYNYIIRETPTGSHTLVVLLWHEKHFHKYLILFFDTLKFCVFLFFFFYTFQIRL